MSQWHLRSKRSATGALIKKNKKKKKFERGSIFLETRIGKRKTKEQRKIGGKMKTKVLFEEKANVYDSKTKKIQTTKIISVEENMANPHYVRRNVLTKGAVIKTEAGLAKVTSRPGQHGVINAILLEKQAKQ